MIDSAVLMRAGRLAESKDRIREFLFAPTHLQHRFSGVSYLNHACQLHFAHVASTTHSVLRLAHLSPVCTSIHRRRIQEVAAIESELGDMQSIELRSHAVQSKAKTFKRNVQLHQIDLLQLVHIKTSLITIIYCFTTGRGLQSSALFNYLLLRLQQVVTPLANWQHAFFSACRSPQNPHYYSWFNWGAFPVTPWCWSVSSLGHQSVDSELPLLLNKITDTACGSQCR